MLSYFEFIYYRFNISYYKQGKTLYFIVLGIVFIITRIASTLHISGYFKCPLTILKGIPKCYYSVGLTGSLLLLKNLQFKEIEKGLE